MNVSVVIPAYNYAHFVADAIESVLAQTVPAGEIIVVNDGSTDATMEVLARFGARIRIVTQVNRGLPAARNAGVARARYPLIAFLDADDTWRPRKLEYQRNCFNADPRLGLVHTGIMHVDASGAPLRAQVDGRAGDVSHDLLLANKAVILGGGSGMMVTRIAFDTVGGFDERMRHSEDWDFWYRLSREYRVGFVPDILVQYRHHGSNMHSSVHLMEQWMLYAFGKAFADPQLRAMRRKCYGNLHTMLSGCYLEAGRIRPALRHAATALVLRPANIARFAGLPIRRLRQRMAETV